MRFDRIMSGTRSASRDCPWRFCTAKVTGCRADGMPATDGLPSIAGARHWQQDPNYRTNPNSGRHGGFVPKAATGACAQAGDLPNGTHQKSIYTESQWQTQAVGHLDLAAQRTDQTEDHRLASLAASATSRVTSSSRRARASLNCASRCLKISVDGHPEETCRERLRSRIISRSRPR
jgi:hypothetical protein